MLSGDAQHALHFLPETNSNTSSRMYLWNRTDGTSQFITDQDLASASLTDDGNFVVYAPYQGITDFWEPPTELIRWDRITGEREVLVSVPEGQTIRGIISGDGRTVIYEVDEDPSARMVRSRSIAGGTGILIGSDGEDSRLFPTTATPFC